MPHPFCSFSIYISVYLSVSLSDMLFFFITLLLWISYSLYIHRFLLFCLCLLPQRNTTSASLDIDVLSALPLTVCRIIRVFFLHFRLSIFSNISHSPHVNRTACHCLSICMCQKKRFGCVQCSVLSLCGWSYLHLSSITTALFSSRSLSTLSFSPSSQHSSLPERLGLSLTERGDIECSERGQCSIAGLYVAGNAMCGVSKLAMVAEGQGVASAFRLNSDLIVEDLGHDAEAFFAH